MPSLSAVGWLFPTAGRSISERCSHQSPRRPRRNVFGFSETQRANVTRDYQRFPANDHCQRGNQPLERFAIHLSAQRLERFLDPFDSSITA
jgi:hypothetical protein